MDRAQFGPTVEGDVGCSGGTPSFLGSYGSQRALELCDASGDGEHHAPGQRRRRPRVPQQIEVQRFSPRSSHAILNAAPVRNPLTEQAREAIARYGINTVPAVIHQRIDHVHAFTAGLAATELAPRGKAARELEALFTWIAQGALL